MQERMEQRAKIRTEEQMNGGGGEEEEVELLGWMNGSACGQQRGGRGVGHQQRFGRGRGGFGRLWNGLGRFGAYPGSNPYGEGNSTRSNAASGEAAEKAAKEAEANAKAMHDALHQVALATAKAKAKVAEAKAAKANVAKAAEANVAKAAEAYVAKAAEANAKVIHESIHQTTGNEEYLRNVGNMVAMAMDPFGIDVDVSVETPDGVRTKVKSTSATSTTTTTNNTAETANEKEDEKKEGMNTEIITVNDDEQMDTMESPQVVNIPISREVTPEKSADNHNAKENASDEEDWTIVKDGSKTPEASGSKSGLYPDLPAQAAPVPMEATEKETPAVAPTNDVTVDNLQKQPAADIPVAVHPDPKIQVALQAMMNMGFNNEGGWLATLLEAKEGDIGKVLDLLQPVKK